MFYNQSFYKAKKESFLQKNIRFNFNDLKNLYSKFLDDEKIEYYSCDEENNANQCKYKSKQQANKEKRIFPTLETKNMCYQNWEIIEEIYNTVSSMNQTNVGSNNSKIIDVIRPKLINQLLHVVDDLKANLEVFSKELTLKTSENDLTQQNSLMIPEKLNKTQRNFTFDEQNKSILEDISKIKNLVNLAKNDDPENPINPISSEETQEIPSTLDDIPKPQTEPMEQKTKDTTTITHPGMINYKHIKKPLLKSYTFINCDVNYFNFKYLVSRTGPFDVIMMDPPWRIKGGQKNDSQFMFANNRFCLEYDTMSNDQIALLDIGVLSKKGFMFLWILGNQINMACEMLNRWGYDLVDLIIWVKTKRGKVYLSHGYYLMHSYEICLVGYKCPPGQHVEYFSKVSNNLIFAEVRSKSQKPEEIYEIIEMMMPGSRKLEIFARNNNLRQGWFSLGNQLGEEFYEWSNHVNCDGCSRPILTGIRRFKSRVKPNFDLCEKCFKKGELVVDSQNQTSSESKAARSRTPYNIDDYFVLNNQVSETVLHKYYSCNVCHMNPIWGLRFSCLDCPNFDLCEGCYDQHLLQEAGEKHPLTHHFHVEEMQKLSLGFQTHLGEKCASCYQKPIIGVCFKCSTCSNLSLCQKCFFNDQHLQVRNRKTHKPDHSWEFFIRPQKKVSKAVCSWCEDDANHISYKCNICFDFSLCSVCYVKRKHFKINKATTHKAYHTFTRLAD